MGGVKKVIMENRSGAVVGDVVEFEVHESGMMLSSLIVYGTPLVFLIAGIAFGPGIGRWAGIGEEPSAAAGGLLGVALSLGIIRLIHLAVGKNRVFTPVMVGIVPGAGGRAKNVNNGGACTDNK